jgi:hypothetical protein
VVWVRQAGAADGLQSSAFLSYELRPAKNPCTTAGMFANPISPQNAGVTVTFTASTSGCDSASYQFWLQPPGGSWYVARPYSTSTTFAWNTAGAASGAWNVAVWIRHSGSDLVPPRLPQLMT